MKRLILVIAIVILSASQCGAKAKNKHVDETLPAAWRGLYLGGDFGALVLQTSKSKSPTNDTLFDQSANRTFKGLSFGGYEGIAESSGNVMYGLEAGFQAGDGVDDHEMRPDQIRYKTNIAYQGSAKLRLGYIHDALLAYATGGIAVAKIDNEFWSTQHGFGSTVQTGWTIGAGVEYKVNQHWSSRVEYNFTDYGVVNFDQPSGSSTLGEIHVTNHALKLGISYQF